MSKLISRRRLLSTTLALAVASTAGGVWAQPPYPNRPVKILVGFAPGGFTDIAARMVAHKLSAALGQPVVVENRPGANGLIASDATSNSPPDGYTLMLSSIGLTTNPLLTKRVHYDPVKSFTPISLLAIVPNVLVTYPGVPAKSLGELLALARTRPSPLTQASAGNGSPGHLSGALLQVMARIRMDHVPYKGSGPAINDLIGGHVDISFPTIPTALPLVRAGKLRALAVTGSKRSPLMPDIPTVAEAGVPGYDTGGWYGLVGPAGMPKDIAALLSKEVAKIMKMPDIRERFLAEGAEPIGSNAADMNAFLVKDVERWTGVVKEAHVEAR
ncbi:Bug family tripartite tricarboxylate transporter substrate binding protein [Cupriavidus basilensis]|uniref:Bug family tripartite tricarboxylate transporter substrate binding protein n=1 Tax=Cupriavidus basilensis TaxID=68895 RepID=UPI0023E876D7|nr:tripartite tricarboxylate transporter substrate binding protein [Cupriavidus basilensis]MDF3887625.1 tripartite tricarboxylate transporter substrate binding protein [Cupriavidus basilensis]